MDKNNIIGFVLIFVILIGWQLLMAPEQKKAAEQQQHQLDSLRKVEQKKADSLKLLPQNVVPITPLPDSQAQQQLASGFGAFAPAAAGTETFEVMENELMRIIFASKGGRIKEVELKQHFKVAIDSVTKKESKLPLKLLEDTKNRFEYLLPVAGVPGGSVSSADLFFRPTKEGNSLIFRADAGEGKYFEQSYTLQPGSYALQYQVNFKGLEGVLNREAETVKLHWINFLDKLEINHKYEVNYSTVYYKPADDDYDYCSCTSNDMDDLGGKPVTWVAHSNQFFASVLIAKTAPFKGAVFETETLLEENADLKKVKADISIPVGGGVPYEMDFYIGPKQFDNLYAYKNDLEDIIPYGASFIGSANRWVIRPLFDFLSGLIGSKGVVILILTLIVKFALYPLSYKMLYSQAKMAALKPQLSSLREKFKDNPTQVQMETMKVYREFGVNPMGGCLPVLLQMPVWLALYRFFPSAIEFRQASFLWATDLSSYDVAFWLPFTVPFGYGNHVSMFTLLWVVTTLWYTWYNMKQMDMSSMGANAEVMKWMQYLMPVFFLFFFNSFASGLTCYLVFSNVLNVLQTVVTKKWVIDNDKIMAELDKNKAKPKKKSGFSARIEEAMKQSQALAAQREAAKTGKPQPKKK